MAGGFLGFIQENWSWLGPLGTGVLSFLGGLLVTKHSKTRDAFDAVLQALDDFEGEAVRAYRMAEPMYPEGPGPNVIQTLSQKQQRAFEVIDRYQRLTGPEFTEHAKECAHFSDWMSSYAIDIVETVEPPKDRPAQNIDNIHLRVPLWYRWQLHRVKLPTLLSKLPPLPKPPELG